MNTKYCFVLPSFGGSGVGEWVFWLFFGDCVGKHMFFFERNPVF